MKRATAKYTEGLDVAFAPADKLSPLSAEDLVAWAIDSHGSRFAVVTAFQPEGMVLVDMALRYAPGTRIVTVDTGRLPQETYDIMDAVRLRYGTGVEVILPDARPTRSRAPALSSTRITSPGMASSAITITRAPRDLYSACRATIAPRAFLEAPQVLDHSARTVGWPPSAAVVSRAPSASGRSKDGSWLPSAGSRS